jgi:hypothetical protein
VLIAGVTAPFSFSPHPIMFCRALCWYLSLSEYYLCGNLQVRGGSQGEGKQGPDSRSPCSFSALGWRRGGSGGGWVGGGLYTAVQKSPV